MKWKREQQEPPPIPKAPDEAVIQKIEQLLRELDLATSNLNKATERALAATATLNQTVQRANRASRRPIIINNPPEKRS